MHTNLFHECYHGRNGFLLYQISLLKWANAIVKVASICSQGSTDIFEKPAQDDPVQPHHLTIESRMNVGYQLVCVSRRNSLRPALMERPDCKLLQNRPDLFAFRIHMTKALRLPKMVSTECKSRELLGRVLRTKSPRMRGVCF